MTKNLLKLGLAVLTILGAGLYAPAQAQTARDSEASYYNATAYSKKNFGGADTNDCVNLAYVGSSTEAVTTITATAMTFFLPSGPDTSVGTSGVITYASTLGANTIDGFCNYLNNLSNNAAGTGSTYVCKKANCKGSDVPGQMFKTQTATPGTNDLKSAGGFGIKMTTNTTVQLGITPAPGKRIVLKQLEANFADPGVSGSANSKRIHVYGQLRKYASGKDEFGAPTASGGAALDTYEVYASSGATNVSKVFPPSSAGTTRWLEFAPNARVVIVGGTTGVGSAAANTAANFLDALWEERD